MVVRKNSTQVSGTNIPAPDPNVPASVAPVVVVPAPPEVMNAADLVTRMLKDMPSLTNVKPLLSHVAALLSYKQMGVPVNEALAELALAKITVKTIRPGIDAIIKAADNADAKSVEKFNEKSGPGREVEPGKMDPNPARDAERAEHTVNRQNAAKLIGRATPLLTGIFGEEDKGGVAGWFRKAVEKADEITLKAEPVVAADLPGWKTPPRLDEGNPDVKALLAQLTLIENTYARVRDPKKTLIQLANLNAAFTSMHVRGVLEACLALANEQIVQSAAIEGVADSDTNAFVAEAKIHDSVREPGLSAEEYLNSGK